MSSFICCKCGTPILDSHEGYISACQHYPIEKRKEVKTMAKTIKKGSKKPVKGDKKPKDWGKVKY